MSRTTQAPQLARSAARPGTVTRDDEGFLGGHRHRCSATNCTAGSGANSAADGVDSADVGIEIDDVGADDGSSAATTSDSG